MIEGVSVTMRPSSDGQGDRPRRGQEPAAARRSRSTDRTVEVPVATDAPDVSDEAAKAAAEEARQMLSAGVEIAYDKRQVGLHPDPDRQVDRVPAQATSPRHAAVASSAPTADETSPDEAPSEPGVSLSAYVDPSKARKLILPKIGAVGRPAKDATFKVSGGSVSVIPSQDGVGPDMEALARELTQVLKDPESTRSVALRTRRVAPKITTAKAQTMGIKERISRYTTTFAASNRPRVSNIHTLADAIDGTLIAPGGTFSFNGTVGPRTAEKGYQEAPAIVDGKLVPQLGGGICQVGTTLFNTIFESGLPVVERHNHSFYISHYPKGRDATVSWGGPDFKFKNDTDHWVLLVTAYSDSSLTIALVRDRPGLQRRSAGRSVAEREALRHRGDQGPHSSPRRARGGGWRHHRPELHGEAHRLEERRRGSHGRVPLRVSPEDRGRAGRHEAGAVEGDDDGGSACAVGSK